jgi:hypothetical protein
MLHLIQDLTGLSYKVLGVLLVQGPFMISQHLLLMLHPTHIWNCHMDQQKSLVLMQQMTSTWILHRLLVLLTLNLCLYKLKLAFHQQVVLWDSVDTMIMLLDIQLVLSSTDKCGKEVIYLIKYLLVIMLTFQNQVFGNSVLMTHQALTTLVVLNG